MLLDCTKSGKVTEEFVTLTRGNSKIPWLGGEGGMVLEVVGALECLPSERLYIVAAPVADALKAFVGADTQVCPYPNKKGQKVFCPYILNNY